MSETDSQNNTTSASKPGKPSVKAVPLSSISANPHTGAIHIPPVAQTPQQPAKPAPIPPAPVAPAAPAAPAVPAVPQQTMTMPAAPAQPANLPIAVPAPDYHPVAGGVNPSGPQPKQPKKHNGLLVVGIIVCVIAAAVLAFAIYYLTNHADEPKVDAPSSAVVEEAFAQANISSPALDSYSYIDTEGLDDPEISSVQVGEVTSNGTGDAQKISCSTTAQATFQNDSVRVEQTVQMPFTYNKSSSTWEAGKPSAQSSSEHVSPTGPVDIEALQEALPELLKAHDENVAAQYEGAEIAATADVTVNGGEITFALSKADANGANMQTDVNVSVVWDNSKGWVPTINWVGQPPADESGEGEGEGEGDQNSSSSASTEANGGNGNAQNPPSDGEMLLNCSTGDLVEVPGVIEYRDNRVLLRSDYTIRVVLDGRTYITNYFELTANTFVVTNGAHVSVIGEISATGTLPQAPLMISLDYED